MENPDFEDIAPGKDNPSQTESESTKPGDTQPVVIGDSTPRQPELEQTIAISLSSNESGQTELGATLPVQVNQSDFDQSDLGETVPTSIKFGEEIPPGFEATIPPPSELYAAGFSGSGGETVPPDNEIPTPKPKKHTLRLAIIGGLIGLVLIALLSGFGGYFSAINARKNAETAQKSLLIQEQLQLAAQDIQDKEYDRARQRLEYVIQNDPNYPGVTDMLAQVILEMNITASPTPVPTPTVTPTPDLRGAEELFNQAQQSMFQGDWTTTINSLLTLRKTAMDYKAVLVDDMLFNSYRNRGKDKILKEGDLEGGIYDLTIAERFGPLDADSKSYLNWARLYILGASFWDVDWGQAVYYFGQVAPALPNLRDGSGWTATERFRLALIGYGDYLKARKEWCPAMKQYEQALAYGGDGNVQESYRFALEKCEGPKKTEPPPEENQPPVEESPTPEGG